MKNHYTKAEKNLKKTLKFLGIKTVDELFDKVLKISFTETDGDEGHEKDGNLIPVITFYKVSTFTVDDDSLTFPRITIDCGRSLGLIINDGDDISLSMFGEKEHPEALFTTSNDENKYGKTFGMFRVKIELLKIKTA